MLRFIYVLSGELPKLSDKAEPRMDGEYANEITTSHFKQNTLQPIEYKQLNKGSLIPAFDNTATKNSLNKEQLAQDYRDRLKNLMSTI